MPPPQRSTLKALTDPSRGRLARNRIIKALVFAGLATLCLCGSPAGVLGDTGGSAAVNPALPSAGGIERGVAQVVDGDTMLLDRPVDGAEEVRLVGLQAPKLALGRRGFADWPLAEEARAELAALVAGHSIRLLPAGTPVDRHGRALAQVVRDDGVWIQGEMLRRGFARVYTFADNRAFAGALYANEQAARAAGRGIWAHPWYAIRTPATVASEVGRFAIVEGTVTAVERVKQKLYLNFGDDWRSDFTVIVPVRLIEPFRDAGIDLQGLKGQTVRIRGWVEKLNGPMIEATHPEQLEMAAAPG